MIYSKPRKTKEYFNKYLYFKRVGAYMKVYDSNMLRNIAVLGHSGCGKTNLITPQILQIKYPNKMIKLT